MFFWFGLFSSASDDLASSCSRQQGNNTVLVKHVNDHRRQTFSTSQEDLDHRKRLLLVYIVEVSLVGRHSIRVRLDSC